MREVVLDTETTGLEPGEGHRIVEIGCVELVNHVPTRSHFQRYLDPERAMDARASEVSGLTDAFLKGKARFADIVDDLLAFLGDSPLVIHNASFDLAFLNAELARTRRAPLPPGRAIDTMLLARRKFPGAPASLDALCRRFGVDLSGRDKHGALIDARLLADVYLELIGGRQTTLRLASHNEAIGPLSLRHDRRPQRPQRLGSRITAEEAAAHAAFIARLKDPLWPALPPPEGDADAPVGLN